jgi:hypothetical protein
MASTPIYNWPTPDNTDLVKNGALAIRTLGDAIDTTMDTMIPETIFAAKGDLLGASANDTPAVLTVGANGETLVADSSTSTGLRYQGNVSAGKNKILNSEMTISQRGTTFTTSPNYTLDRWYYNNFGTSTNSSTVSQLTTSPPTNFSSFCEVAAGSATPTNFFMSYSMETAEVIPLQGKTVTVSLYYKLPTNFTNIWNIVGVYSTNTNQNLQGGAAGATNIGSATALTNTNSWTRTSITFTVPSNATSLGLNLYTTSNIVATGKFDFTGVQLEEGSVATAFQTATGTIQGELAACQRYYYRTTIDAIAGRLGSGFVNSTSTLILTVPYPVTMRTKPTALEQNGTAGDYQVLTTGNTITTCTGVPVFISGTQAMQGVVELSTGATLIAGQAGVMRIATANAYLGWSAEL